MLSFVGTLHAHLTDHEELKEVIEDITPDILLVEIMQEDIEKDNGAEYPDEMQFAYAWAQGCGIPVFGFDAHVESDKASDKEMNERVIARQAKYSRLIHGKK